MYEAILLMIFKKRLIEILYHLLLYLIIRKLFKGNPTSSKVIQTIITVISEIYNKNNLRKINCE